ncbi:MAG: molybdopterin-dependent oxidoreductase [Dethiobacter sp.]|nr:molybdopterin-dependent oxidoreductase [Dethiobacter sp.]
MHDYKVVGHSVKKADALDKVLGAAKYAADIQMEGMLYAKVLRSTLPHGIVKSIDVSAAKKMDGVKAVLTAADIPGGNSTGIIIKDQPIMSGVNQKVRMVGDALAIVAAESEETAAKALGRILVEIEPLPGVFSAVEAMKEDAPRVYDNGNILGVRKIIKGDAEAAFNQCAVVVEDEYTTQMTEHAYIETEAGVATVDGGMVTVWVSTQNPHYDRKEIARNLNIGMHQVRVVQSVTGGGFGGKLDISVQVFLALLAKATRRPVKMVYSRPESITTTVKRHPYFVRYKSGALADGTLHAVECTIIGDTGAYASYGPGVLTRAAVHATGPYEAPNVRILSYTVYTNNPQAGAMRGFGVPQIAFVHEEQMNMLAVKLGISPLEIRLRNALRPGSVTATGATLTQSVGIVQTLEAAAAKAREVLSPESLNQILNRGGSV